jgi:hypothetical protein
MKSYISGYGSMRVSKTMEDIIKSIQLGFNFGLVPRLVDEGTSGSYFLRGPDQRNLAIYKPLDEEPFAPNNPRDFPGDFGSDSLRSGVKSGEMCSREVAAYMIDTDHYLGVPRTAIVEIIHPSFKSNPFMGLDVTSKFYKDQINNLLRP